MTNGHDDRVRDRAYHLWQASGGVHGQEMEHWLQAERDVAEADTDPAATTKPSAPKKPKVKDAAAKGADAPAKKAAKTADTKAAKAAVTAKPKGQRDGKRGS